MRPVTPTTRRFVVVRLWLALTLAVPLGLFTRAQQPLAAPPPAEAGMGVWTSDGPYGGNIQDVAFSPGFAQDRTVFVATTQGVFKSTNGGDNWVRASTGITVTDITALALAPNYTDTETIFAGTIGGGIFKSQDGGQAWTNISEGLFELNLASLAVAPTYALTPTVLAGTATRLYRSDNGGLTWEPQSWVDTPPLFGQDLNANAIAFSPDYADDQKVWLGTQAGLLHSDQVEVRPSGRHGHTTVYDSVRQQMLVFGGEGYNDVWALNLDTGVTWTRLNPSGTPPALRHSHSAIYDSANDRMVIFGGDEDSGTFLNDTWALDRTTLAWTQLTPTGTPPGGRKDHTAIYDSLRGQMIVFGGEAGGVYLNDVWALNLTTLAWSQLTPSGTPPSERSRHAAVYASAPDRMIIFGGLPASNDTWSLDLATLAWSQLNPLGTLPSPRYDHSAIYDSVHDQIIVFGGLYGFYSLVDVWRLDLSAPSWLKVHPTGTPWPSRSEHAAIYDVAHQRMIAFGGNAMPCPDGCSGVAEPLAASCLGAPGCNDTLALDLAIAGTEAWYVPTRVSALSLSPAYPADGTLLIGAPTGVFKSADAGATWSSVNGLPAPVAVQALALSPNYANDHIAFAGTDSGVYRSSDGGLNWVAVNNGLNALDAQALALSPAFNNGQTLFVGTGSGVFRSPNGGQGWTAANVGLKAVNVQRVAVSPAYETDHTLFAATDTGLHKSTDTGQIWTPVNNGIPTRQTYDVVLSPGYQGDQTLFAATEAGLYRSGNGGGGWASFNDGLAAGGLSRLAISPNFVSDQTLFALPATSGIQRSTNGGGTWQPAEVANLPGQALAVSPAFGSDGQVWAGTLNGLFSSPDRGLSWHGWPAAYGSPMAVYDSSRERMLVFGYYLANDGQYVTDLRSLDLTTHRWTQLSPTGLPLSYRNDGTLIYDAAQDRLLLFGGYGPSYQNDLWALDLETLLWTQLSPLGTPPPGREGHTAIYDLTRQRMLVFGGRGELDSLNDVWALDLTTLAWTQLSPAGTPPGGREDHTAIYDVSHDRMIVWGGTEGSIYYNDVGALDLTTLAWTQLNPAGTLPSARASHTAVYDGAHERMLVFGGYNHTIGWFQDTWMLDLTTPAWSQVNPTGAPPPALMNHTAIYDAAQGQMLVFGGCCSQALWSLDLVSLSWTAADSAGYPPPNLSLRHTAIHDTAHARMVVYGGSCCDYNETWGLDLTSDMWNRLSTTGAPPQARVGHTALYDAAHHRMLVFGGIGINTAVYHNDLWALDLNTLAWTQLTPTGSPPPVRYGHTTIHDVAHDRMIVFGGINNQSLNDTWVLNLSTLTWTPLTPTGVPPLPRQGHTAIYDAAHQRMLVYGGYDDFTATDYNDLWALDLNTLAWTQLNPGGPPPPALLDHSAIYDPAQDRMIVFGGDYANAYLWALNLTTLVWAPLNPTGEPPAARSHHTAIHDPTANRMIVYGGKAGWTLGLDSAATGPWSQIPAISNFTQQSVRLLAVSPSFAADQTMLLVSEDYLVGEDYVYGSSDGGTFWAALSKLTNVTDILFSPTYASDQTVYAVAEGDIHYSTDGGLSWTQLSEGFTANTLAIAPEGNTWTLFAAATDGVWTYTFPRPESVRTLILTNQARLAERYGPDAAEALLHRLYDLADHAEVQGLVVDVGDAAQFPTLAANYAAWDATLSTSPTVPAGPYRLYLPLITRYSNQPGLNTQLANRVAMDIRQVVLDHTASFSNTQYLVLVGGDDILPFHRLPDGTASASLPYSTYAPLQGSLAHALADRMTLSDDPYASLHPITLTTGSLFYVPELSAGRLVESPDDIRASLMAFLASTQINEHALALVSGADNYLIDGAFAISDTLEATHFAVSSLVGNTWTADDLAARLLQGDNDLVSLNQHAYHNKLLAPDNTFLAPQQVLSATGDLERTLIYAMGCHAGLSVPDHLNGALGLDFPQAFAKRGAPFVGNTGYGWATLYAVGLTERLLLYYSQALAPAPASTTTIGQALRDAKQRYYLNAWALDDYDQKVVNELTLYGLPMYRLSTPLVQSEDMVHHQNEWAPTLATLTYSAGDPQWLASLATQPSAVGSLQSADDNRPATHHLDRTPVQVSLNPSMLNASVPPSVTQASIQFQFPQENFDLTGVGDALYYTYAGEVQANRGLPLLPRFSFGVAIAGARTQGVVFVSGIYSDVIAAPVTTTAIISDTGGLDPSTAYVPGQWYPTVLDLVTQLAGGGNDRLTTSLGQMRGDVGGGGSVITPTQRLYNQVAFEVYYYNQYFGGAPDRTAPQVNQVQVQGGQVRVQVTDLPGGSDTAALGVWRVLATVTPNTAGTGQWSTVELSYDPASGRWLGPLPTNTGLFFIQAIDNGGNVTANDNNGWYFTP